MKKNKMYALIKKLPHPNGDLAYPVQKARYA